MPASIALSFAKRRIAIVGCPGSGKSTLARYLANANGVRHVELDGLYHQPNWVPLEAKAFRRVLREQTPVDGEWVACGNYGSTAGDDMRERADCIVFLDLPRGLTLRRMIQRTLRRLFKREELWNGNRERWWNMIHPNPSENIILWTCVKWKPYRVRYRKCIAEGTWAHAQVVHLTCVDEVRRFMALFVADRSAVM